MKKEESDRERWKIERKRKIEKRKTTHRKIIKSRTRRKNKENEENI